MTNLERVLRKNPQMISVYDRYFMDIEGNKDTIIKGGEYKITVMSDKPMNRREFIKWCFEEEK